MTKINVSKEISQLKKSISFLRKDPDMYDLNLPETPVTHKMHRDLTFEELKGLVSRLEEEIKLPFSMHIMGYTDKMIAAKTGIEMDEVASRIDKGYGLTALYLKEHLEPG